MSSEESWICLWCKNRNSDYLTICAGCRAVKPASPSQPRSAETSDAPPKEHPRDPHKTEAERKDCPNCYPHSQPGSNEELTELERIAVIIQMNATRTAASLIQALLTTRERNLLNKLSLYIPDESMIAGTGGKTGDEYWRAVGHAEGVKELADTIYRFIARETATLAESKETGV